MNISKEEKKAEAIGRMIALGIFPETIRQFEEDDYISISEPPFGAFFWAEGEDLQHIREFEEEYNALVYCVVRSYTTIGKMDSYLYVSDYESEWKADRADLLVGEPYVFAYNHDAPDYSGLGRIGIKKTVAAGLRRLW